MIRLEKIVPTAIQISLIRDKDEDDIMRLLHTAKKIINSMSMVSAEEQNKLDMLKSELKEKISLYGNGRYYLYFLEKVMRIEQEEKWAWGYDLASED